MGTTNLQLEIDYLFAVGHVASGLMRASGVYIGLNPDHAPMKIR